LKIQVIHAPDSEGLTIVEHLGRIGCQNETTWPLPDELAPDADVVLMSIEQENREQILKLCRQTKDVPPTILAVASYEDPGTLQIILECEALSVIERPVRLFGLLTNLTIARSLWTERHKLRKKVKKLERRLDGNHMISRAKNILWETQNLDENAAHESIRKQAMAKRQSMADISGEIVKAYEILTFSSEK
jgi:AmiR/NasT family two-component response regulator